jgi:hypothetical protein
MRAGAWFRTATTMAGSPELPRAIAAWVRLGPRYALENRQLVLKGVCYESLTRASAARTQAGIVRRIPP